MTQGIENPYKTCDVPKEILSKRLGKRHNGYRHACPKLPIDHFNSLPQNQFTIVDVGHKILFTLAWTAKAGLSKDPLDIQKA